MPKARRWPKGQAGTVPVLVLERFDTFELGKRGSRVARGAGLILFDGFQLDLDAGQVVPAGRGATGVPREGNARPALKTLGEAALFTLSKPIAPNAAGAPARRPARRSSPATSPADTASRPTAVGRASWN